jgi:hypothetical protein
MNRSLDHLTRKYMSFKELGELSPKAPKSFLLNEALAYAAWRLEEREVPLNVP